MPEICDPASVVIFGASGDLTHRKLIPALYNLYLKGRLPEAFQIVGVSRTEYSHKEFRNTVQESVQTFSQETFDSNKWNKFEDNIFYVPGNSKQKESYEALDQFLRQRDGAAANRLYYLSLAPSLYEPTLINLRETGMADEDEGWRRIVVEKPFGYDLASAQNLNRIVFSAFTEEQVYRIDHYLGKETAQNILFFRFANTIFEPIWNRNFIDHVQISVLETVDVDNRADYYDSSGVIRDMFQNHLMQLLALTAMEPPISLRASDLRLEKSKVIKAIRPILNRDTIRAQYEGYKDTKGVAPDSKTPTFAALKLYIDNWRWEGVPFYLRSGKALAQKTSEILVQFRRPPLRLFGPYRRDQSLPNSLSICIQPDEGIHLGFEAKLPDSREGRLVELEFHYDDAFGKGAIPEAYERLILDALLGDAALFAHKDEIEASWRLMDAVIEGWNNDHTPPPARYSPGTWGPVEADDLLDIDGHAWQLACLHCED